LPIYQSPNSHYIILRRRLNSTTSATRRPERDVQHGAAFRRVDLLAGKHRVAPAGDPAIVDQRQKELQRLVGDAVLGVVEE